MFIVVDYDSCFKWLSHDEIVDSVSSMVWRMTFVTWFSGYGRFGATGRLCLSLTLL